MQQFCLLWLNLNKKDSAKSQAVSKLVLIFCPIFSADAAVS